MSDFLDILTDFVLEQMPQYSDKPKEMKYALAGHYQFGTLDFDFDSFGIAYLVRFNVEGEVAEVLDLCIRKDLRGKGLLRMMGLKNWARFPLVKKIRFERGKKYPNRSKREYWISEIVNKEK